MFNSSSSTECFQNNFLKLANEAINLTIIGSVDQNFDHNKPSRLNASIPLLEKN